jgi:hypothetical protein
MRWRRMRLARRLRRETRLLELLSLQVTESQQTVLLLEQLLHPQVTVVQPLPELLPDPTPPGLAELIAAQQPPPPPEPEPEMEPMPDPRLEIAQRLGLPQPQS